MRGGHRLVLQVAQSVLANRRLLYQRNLVPVLLQDLLERRGRQVLGILVVGPLHEELQLWEGLGEASVIVPRSNLATTAGMANSTR